MTCIIELNKNSRIMTTINKSKRRRDHNKKFLKPSMRCLFETCNVFLSLQTYPELCKTPGGGTI